MTTDPIDNLKEAHDKDIERIDKELDKKVDKEVFQARVTPIEWTTKTIIGAAVTLMLTIIGAIIIPLLQ